MSLQQADLEPLLGRIVTVHVKTIGQMSEGRLQRVTESAICLYPVLVISTVGELVFTDDCIAVLDLAEVLSVRSTPDDTFQRTYQTMTEDLQEQHASHLLHKAQAKKEREKEELVFQQSQPKASAQKVQAVGQYL
jgi:ABC-type cobalamin transport system ATPase subunit